MNKQKKSGPAIFMDCVIAVTLVTAGICLYLHYFRKNGNSIILWMGVTSFTIMYHLWLRLLFGDVTRLLRDYIHYEQNWFREQKFEKKLYQILRVKKWKGKALTYDPAAFSLKDHSLEEIANTMSKSELDHWINEIISLSTLLFALIWGEFWIFCITAVAAMIFDAQFIVIQRYNRPRVIRLIEKTAA